MAIQGGIATLAAVLIFPESVGHAFQGKLIGILDPLVKAIRSVEQLLEDAADSLQSDPVDTLTTKASAIRTLLLKSLAGLPPLRAQQSYLTVDFSYSRLSSHDLRELFDRLAVVQARSGGVAFFFDVIVTSARHSHLDSSAFSVQQASASRPGSRPPSLHEMVYVHRQSDDGSDEDAPHRKSHFPFLHRRSGSPLGLGRVHRGSHPSLLDHLRKVQQPVGVYESQRYMDVERAYNK